MVAVAAADRNFRTTFSLTTTTIIVIVTSKHRPSWGFIQEALTSKKLRYALPHILDNIVMVVQAVGSNVNVITSVINWHYTYLWSRHFWRGIAVDDSGSNHTILLQFATYRYRV